MDFTGLDPALRVVLFGGEFLSLAAVAGWFLFAREPRGAQPYQVGASVGALLGLPALLVAAVRAPSAGLAELSTLTGLLSLLGFVVVTVTTAAYLFATRQAMASSQTTVPSALEGSPSLSSQRPRTDDALTVGGPDPVGDGEQTVVQPAPTGDETPLAYLVDKDQPGRRYRLGLETVIGRGSPCHLVVDEPMVSRVHAKVKYEGGRFVLSDASSINGTYHERAGVRQRIQTATPLEVGDVVGVGNTHFIIADS